MTTASHQQHHFCLLNCPCDNTAATMGKNGQQQPSKRHLPIATEPTAKSSTLHHSREQPHPLLIQHRLRLLVTLSNTVSINAASIFGRIPPADESTEGDQFQSARRHFIFHNPPRPRTINTFTPHPIEAQPPHHPLCHGLHQRHLNFRQHPSSHIII